MSVEGLLGSVVLCADFGDTAARLLVNCFINLLTNNSVLLFQRTANTAVVMFV